MVQLLTKNCKKSLVDQLSDQAYSNQGDVRLWWLGQAGFLIQYGTIRLLIDAYLSDCLAKKYANAKFQHIRMQPSPIDAASLDGIDWILCTHRHSDHMDPESLPQVLRNNTQCKMVYPRAETAHVSQFIPSEKCIPVNAGESVPLTHDIKLYVIASAHEELAEDADKNHKYLGYIVTLGDVTIYHSGDCVPYEGLTEALCLQKIDVALLPVNGRDEYRRTHNIAGNFTFDEALALCRGAKIPYLIPHHFGMFNFNTVDIDWLNKKTKAVSDKGFICLVPRIDKFYKMADVSGAQ